MGVYLDAVLTKSMEPVFNGTPDETKAWLKKRLAAHDNADVNTLQVCVGKTLMIVSVKEYMAG